MTKHYMYLGADAGKEPYYFNIDGDMADQIVGKWLLRNIEYAKSTIKQGSSDNEDWIEADKYLSALRRTYLYLTGEHLED